MQLRDFIIGHYKSSTVRQFIGLLLIFLAACAQPVAPTGGPRDTDPPVIIRSEPENGSVNFDATEIRIWFDEFIQVRGLSQQFLSSPPFKKVPETRVRGKSLIIRFDEELRINTTYTLFFGDAISDFTEGNPLSNFRYVFSTGPVLDSMLLSGKVLNAYDLKPEKEVFVMLYDIYEDSIPYQERPYYISRTNDKGEFNFTNLRDMPYKIFALRDVNANLIYDLPNEEIGFIDSLVHPFAPIISPLDTLMVDTLTFENDTILQDQMPPEIPETEISETDTEPDQTDESIEDEIMNGEMLQAIQDSVQAIKKEQLLTLFLFTEVDSTQRLERAGYLHPNRVNFIFRYPAQNLSINPLPPIEYDWKIPEVNKHGDTIIYWMLDIERDSLILEINAKHMKTDTVKLSLEQLYTHREERKADTVARKIEVASALRGRAPIDTYKPAELSFSEPVAGFDAGSLVLLEDSVAVTPELYFRDELQKVLLIDHPWQDTTRYDLFIPDSVFISIYGAINDTIQYTFRTKNQSDYGSFKLNLEHTFKEGNLIVELLDERDRLIRRKIIGHEQTTVVFVNLNPLKYKFKIIHDANANKRWDTGVYLEGLQPERVYIYDKTIELRPNWDMEETFTIGDSPSE